MNQIERGSTNPRMREGHGDHSYRADTGLSSGEMEDLRIMLSEHANRLRPDQACMSASVSCGHYRRGSNHPDDNTGGVICQDGAIAI